MRKFKIVVLGSSGRAKYIYNQKSFEDIHQAIQYYERGGNRVIEAKEMNVRLVVLSPGATRDWIDRDEAPG